MRKTIFFFFALMAIITENVSSQTTTTSMKIATGNAGVQPALFLVLCIIVFFAVIIWSLLRPAKKLN